VRLARLVCTPQCSDCGGVGYPLQCLDALDRPKRSHLAAPIGAPHLRVSGL